MLTVELQVEIATSPVEPWMVVRRWALVFDSMRHAT
jgi:ABC-type Mn2+/Zn2+ transport system permease subunit